MTSKAMLFTAITILSPQGSQAMQADLYEEIYAHSQNDGRDFKPVPRPAPGMASTSYDQMQTNYTLIAKQNYEVQKRQGYQTLQRTSIRLQD